MITPTKDVYLSIVVILISSLWSAMDISASNLWSKIAVPIPLLLALQKFIVRASFGIYLILIKTLIIVETIIIIS